MECHVECVQALLGEDDAVSLPVQPWTIAHTYAGSGCRLRLQWRHTQPHSTAELDAFDGRTPNVDYISSGVTEDLTVLRTLDGGKRAGSVKIWLAVLQACKLLISTNLKVDKELDYLAGHTGVIADGSTSIINVPTPDLDEAGDDKGVPLAEVWEMDKLSLLRTFLCVLSVKSRHGRPDFISTQL